MTGGPWQKAACECAKLRSEQYGALQRHMADAQTIAGLQEALSAARAKAHVVARRELYYVARAAAEAGVALAAHTERLHALYIQPNRTTEMYELRPGVSAYVGRLFLALEIAESWFDADPAAPHGAGLVGWEIWMETHLPREVSDVTGKTGRSK